MSNKLLILIRARVFLPPRSTVVGALRTAQLHNAHQPVEVWYKYVEQTVCTDVY